MSHHNGRLPDETDNAVIEVITVSYDLHGSQVTWTTVIDTGLEDVPKYHTVLNIGLL